jgi:hypothetical protein
MRPAQPHSPDSPCKAGGWIAYCAAAKQAAAGENTSGTKFRFTDLHFTQDERDEHRHN